MTDCKYRSHSGYCHRCGSFGECREEQLAEIRLANSRPTTPETWLEKYNALLKIGGGLTAREWDHHDQLKRTVADTSQLRGTE